MTTYLRPDMEPKPKCDDWHEEAGTVLIELYAGEETLTTIEFSDQAPRNPEDKRRATSAYWVGENDTKLIVTWKKFPDGVLKTEEYPRERVCRVERRTIAHDREHDWMIREDTRPHPATEKFRGYSEEYVAENGQYASGWLAWCEGCDVAREATPEEIQDVTAQAEPVMDPRD